MKVLMLSTDRTVFDRDSATRKRMEEYAAALGSLTVIVFAKGHREPQIAEKLSLYPTDSFSKVFYIPDAIRLGLSIGKGAAVVSAQDPFETGFAASRIAEKLGIPLHIQVHTNLFAPGFAEAHWPLNELRLMIAPSVIARAAGIRVVSEDIRAALEERYHPKAHVSVLPVYADLERFAGIARSRHPRFSTTLLVVSRLEKEKRIPLAVEALKKARDAGFDCGLVIVGSGREEAALGRLAKRLGVAEWVEFAGFQNNPLPYYARADALLYPGAPYEGFVMAIPEALTAGVPVLAGDAGGARQMGAEIAEGDFGDALVALLKRGLPKASLLYRPYASKEDYVRKIAEDLALAASVRNTHP